MRTGIWIALALGLGYGCSGDDGGAGTVEDCGTCADEGAVCTVYAEGDPADWTESCAPLPPECTGDDPCSITECVGAMYGLCDPGTIGQSNSCSAGGFVSVTCSPDA
jgi:hypothetical protein